MQAMAHGSRVRVTGMNFLAWGAHAGVFRDEILTVQVYRGGK